MCQILWEDASRLCAAYHVTKSWNRKLIRVTSSNERLKHKSISVTSAYILTQFGTEHKCHTINTSEWLNSHNLKKQDGGGRHLEFQKNVNNFGLDKDILDQIIWEDAPRPCGEDRVTKSRNRKLIRVTSSKECLKHMCVDLSNYNRYLTKFGTEHKYHTINMPEWPNSHKLKIQDGGGRHLEFRKNVNNSGLDKDICTKFYVKMTTRPKVETGS